MQHSSLVFYNSQMVYPCSFLLCILSEPHIKRTALLFLLFLAAQLLYPSGRLQFTCHLLTCHKLQACNLHRYLNISMYFVPPMQKRLQAEVFLACHEQCLASESHHHGHHSGRFLGQISILWERGTCLAELSAFWPFLNCSNLLTLVQVWKRYLLNY